MPNSPSSPLGATSRSSTSQFQTYKEYISALAKFDDRYKKLEKQFSDFDPDVKNSPRQEAHLRRFPYTIFEEAVISQTYKTHILVYSTVGGYGSPQPTYNTQLLTSIGRHFDVSPFMYIGHDNTDDCHFDVLPSQRQILHTVGGMIMDPFTVQICYSKLFPGSKLGKSPSSIVFMDSRYKARYLFTNAILISSASSRNSLLIHAESLGDSTTVFGKCIRPGTSRHPLDHGFNGHKCE